VTFIQWLYRLSVAELNRLRAGDPADFARAAWDAATERAAVVCEQVHAELDEKFGPDGGCTDAALVAARRIREGRTP
jgi:hypothetical protein